MSNSGKYMISLLDDLKGVTSDEISKYVAELEAEGGKLKDRWDKPDGTGILNGFAATITEAYLAKLQNLVGEDVSDPIEYIEPDGIVTTQYFGDSRTGTVTAFFRSKTKIIDCSYAPKILEERGNSMRSTSMSVPDGSIKMLNRQYGIAAPSSVVKVVHPEDSQPNEKIHGRNRNLPPRVVNTARPPRFDRIASNSGERSSQLARRGSWRGRGPGRTNMTRQVPHSDDNARDSKAGNGYSSFGSSSTRTLVEGNLQVSKDNKLSYPASYAHPQILHSASAGPEARAIHPPALQWHYRSPSPKLPLEPFRRRAPLDGQTRTPLFNPSSASQRSLPIPLPGRKRNAVNALPSEPSPLKKLKTNLGVQQVTPSAKSDQPCTNILVIKDESPPPEPIRPSRKLVKGACSFWRIPDNCKKSDPHHQDNRKAFAKERIKELSKLNLKRTKVFFREDGLVVEWKSDVPVWNDTLLPEPTPSNFFFSADSTSSASKPNSFKRKQATSETIDALLTPVPDKRSGFSNVESSACSTEQTEAERSQPQILCTQPRQSSANIPSPKKGKIKDKPEKHWAAGLSKGNIRKLGKGVEVLPSDSKPLPRSSSSNSTLNTSAISPVRSSSFDRARVDVECSSTRRPALPTRIVREKVCEFQTDTTTSSNPECEKECPIVTPAAPPVVQSEGLKLPEDDSGVKPSSSAFSDHDDIYVDDEPGIATPLHAELGGKEDVMIFAKEGFAGRKSDDTAEEVICELPLHDRVASSLLGEIQGVHLMAEAPRIGDMEESEKRDDDARQEGSVADETVLQDQLQYVEEIDCSGTAQDDVLDSPGYEIAVEFLQRFIQLFDTDRTQLQMAYSKDAQFSYRLHNARPHSVSSAGLFAPESAAAMIHHGRSAIIDRLCAFGNYQFAQRGVPSKTVYYDLAALSQEIIGNFDGVSTSDDGASILATLHSEVMNPNSEDPNSNHVLTLDQSFVLRRRTDRDDNIGDVLGGISGLVINALSNIIPYSPSFS